ncbi:SDR family oxidoreductase [Algihabitans albus]|uniref:SDR family oxidoreductase n=1 Tax=Algihabitans albus TaxID=2164067 RepID=UPI000E5CE33B|nr:sugar nucleotide-binding protein [Algihabitans albus]
MQDRAKVLVTGSSGNLGRFVLSALDFTPYARNFCIATLSRRAAAARRDRHYRIDLTDREALTECLATFRPTKIIHLAALSSPSEAHKHPQLARAVNVDAVETIAAYAERAGARLMMTSSDYVFDGTLGRPYRETDAAEPQTVYGRSKLAAEAAVLRSGGVVARLSLLHEEGVCATTLQSLIHDARLARRPVSIAADETRSPLRFSDAASALVRLAFLPDRGVFHVSGPERLSPFDIVTRELRATAHVLPVCRIGRDRLMPPARPADVSLDSSKLRAACPDLHFARVAPPVAERAIGQTALDGVAD